MFRRSCAPRETLPRTCVLTRGIPATLGSTATYECCGSVALHILLKRATAGMRMLVQVRLQMRLLLRVATQAVVRILLEQRRKAGLVP